MKSYIFTAAEGADKVGEPRMFVASFVIVVVIFGHLAMCMCGPEISCVGSPSSFVQVGISGVAHKNGY